MLGCRHWRLTIISGVIHGTMFGTANEPQSSEGLTYRFFYNIFEETQITIQGGSMLCNWIRSFQKSIVKTNTNTSNLASFRDLKRALGWLGMVLPAICILGGLFPGHNLNGLWVQPSISHYYHTNMRDVLVGLLGCVAILFMTYSGYGWVDDVITWAIGVAGTGFIIFPGPTYPPSDGPAGILQLTQSTSGTVHLWSSFAFFFLLAVNSIVLFTLTNKGEKEELGQPKIVRNAIYIASGGVILASLLTLGLIDHFAQHFFDNSSIGLIFETVMLLAFGVSWLVKGGFAPLRD